MVDLELIGGRARVRYVAIGDSFTEGVGDEQPDGSVRGWADLVAAGLAAANGGTVQYANLAIRGRLLEPIVTDQLDAALALSPTPTLMTFNGGGNDMLRPRTDVAHLMALTERAVRRCLAAGVRLVLLSGADPSARLPFGKMIRRRGEELTAGAAALAAKYDIVFVNVFHDTEIRRSHYWSADRLHLNAAGHQRVAGLVLEALGNDVSQQPSRPELPEARRLSAEARYYWEHVRPWVQRRLRGHSSGDQLYGKHVSWTDIEPSHV
jgi:lysophospholipase L1-like esterase